MATQCVLRCARTVGLFGTGYTACFFLGLAFSGHTFFFVQLACAIMLVTMGCAFTIFLSELKTRVPAEPGTHW